MQIFSDSVVLIDARSLNGMFKRTQTSRQKQLENFLTSAKNAT